MNSKSQVLEQTIHSSIPLSQTLEFHIQDLTDNSIEVTAPLAPNINIHNAAFAGSIYSVAALTAWGLVTHLANEAGLHANVVIGKAEIFYRQPIVEAIKCECRVTSKMLKEFLAGLQSKGRSKMTLSVGIGSQSEAAFEAVVFATCIEKH